MESRVLSRVFITPKENIEGAGFAAMSAKEIKVPSKKLIESRGEMESILRQETMGYLGLSVDGMPYVVPLNYGYVEGKILFHCALTGKKLEYMRTNPQVCFTVGRQFGKVVRHPRGAVCHADHDSVICYGVARIVENLEERRKILETFNRCLQPDAAEITSEAASRCYAVEIEIAEMTGRQQRGSEHTYWKYSFAATR
jgi:nitroimidazol reductase NimA-like FMN-containing flavoprotein (pyridoxamine 5'-phosphate oxidase superfamily)